MAEGNEVSNEDTEIHIQNLADLWRICGNRLKKNQAKLPDNIQLQGLQRIFEKYFQINPEKDDFAIHPPRFCNLCFATHTHEIMCYWEIHTELQYLCKRGERLLDWGVESQKI